MKGWVWLGRMGAYTLSRVRLMAVDSTCMGEVGGWVGGWMRWRKGWVWLGGMGAYTLSRVRLMAVDSTCMGEVGGWVGGWVDEAYMDRPLSFYSITHPPTHPPNLPFGC